MAHQVFLSHATEDRDTASRLCGALEAEDIRCWIAPRDVEGGTDYAAAILDAIKSAQLVVLASSASANASPYVLREIERAIAYERPVVSVRLDDATPNASLEYYLNLWQKLDATAGIEQKNDEIIGAVRGAIAAPGAVARSKPGARKGAAKLFRGSRRKWWIALASVLVVVAVGLGLGFGLAGHNADSSPSLTGSHNTWAKRQARLWWAW